MFMAQAPFLAQHDPSDTTSYMGQMVSLVGWPKLVKYSLANGVSK